MDKKKIKVIYLMGAGRSGTTALAVFLGGALHVKALGELHQLPEHANGIKNCSCGAPLNKCTYWSQYNIELSSFATQAYTNEAKEFESHKNIRKYLFVNDFGIKNKSYSETNIKLFSQCSHNGNIVLLDSAKYIGRAIALSKCPELDLRILYLVRDPRGVVESFGKAVQTSRGILSSSSYYFVINLLAELISRTTLRNKVLKLRYEDMLNSPNDFFSKISDFCDIDTVEVSNKIRNNEKFNINHFIGGNRLIENKAINMSQQVSWHNKMPRWKQLLVFFLTLPLNLINHYKP